MAATADRPATRRFTSDEVWRMVEVGLLGPDEPYELIDGELCYVSPQDPPHAGSVGWATMALAPRYAAAGCVVRVQLPIGGIRDSIPEPDVAVVPAQANSAATHPRADQTLLIVEISDTSVRRDIRKGEIYAVAGAPVYWRIDIPSRTAVVHAGPLPDGSWTETRTVGPDALLDLPGVEAAVRLGDILPRS